MSSKQLSFKRGSVLSVQSGFQEIETKAGGKPEVKVAPKKMSLSS
jgi:hypothetical protein